MDVDNPPAATEADAMETDPIPLTTTADGGVPDLDGDEQMEAGDHEGEELELYEEGEGDVEFAEEGEEVDAEGDIEITPDVPGEEEFVVGEGDADVELAEPVGTEVTAETTVEGTDTEITAPTALEPAGAETIEHEERQADQGNVAVEPDPQATEESDPTSGHEALVAADVEGLVEANENEPEAEVEATANFTEQNDEGEQSNAGVLEADANATQEDAHATAGDDEVQVADADGDEQEDEDDGVYDLLTYDTLPPVLLNLPNAQRALFNPIMAEDASGASSSSSAPVWFADKTQELVEGTLTQLWAAIRAQLEEEGSGNEVDEMVIIEKLTDLKMGDSDVNLEDITFLELVQMYHDCGLPEPMELHVEFHPHRFITRFNAIQKELQAREVVFVEDDEDEQHMEAQDADEEKHEVQVEEGAAEVPAAAADQPQEQLPVPLPEPTSHDDAQPSKALTVEATSDETTADPTDPEDNSEKTGTDQPAEPAQTAKPSIGLASSDFFDMLIGSHMEELAQTSTSPPVATETATTGDPASEQIEPAGESTVADVTSIQADAAPEGQGEADTVLTSSVTDQGASEVHDEPTEVQEAAHPATDPNGVDDVQEQHGNVALDEEHVGEGEDEGEYEEADGEYDDDEGEEGEGDEQDPYGVDKFVDGVDAGPEGVANGEGEVGADEEVYEEYEEEDAEYEVEEQDEDDLAPDSSVDPETAHGLDLDADTNTNGEELHDEVPELDAAASPVKRTRSTAEEEDEDEESTLGKRAKLDEPQVDAETT